MLKIAAAEFESDVRRFEELALAEPVMVTREGKADLVVVSATHYWSLVGHQRGVLGAEEFSDEDLAAIAATEPPEKAYEFKHEYSR